MEVNEADDHSGLNPLELSGRVRTVKLQENELGDGVLIPLNCRGGFERSRPKIQFCSNGLNPLELSGRVRTE